MITLGQQEFQDPRWVELERSFRERNPARAKQAAEDIAEIGSIYERHAHHWEPFQDAMGIMRPRRGPAAASRFQPVCRHLLGLGIGGDQSGQASVWAAVLDASVKTGIAASEIPAWIAGTEGGIRAIYDAGKPDKRNDNVYTGGILPHRIVDYLPIGTGDFCIDPCRGRGAFFNVLPKGRRDWCGLPDRDFLTREFDKHVDWAITNPPFSDLYAGIAARAFAIADNVVFLVKFDVALNTYARQKAWREAGHGLREVHIIPWKDAEFVNEDGTAKQAEGFCLALVWWTRGWPDLFEHRLPEIEDTMVEAAE